MKIEEYYRKYFLRIVTIPLIAILIIVMVWVGQVNAKERREGLKFSAENVKDKLSEEISDYSTRFSYFMSSNNKEVIDNINMHSKGDIYQRYKYDKELLHWYNLNVIQISPFTSIDFYLNNDNKYSFESSNILDKKYIQEQNWYKNSINAPDKICIDIVKSKDIINNYKEIKEEELIIASMSMKEFAKGTSVEMGVLTAKSKALEMIKKPKDWIYDYHIYLVSDDGRILCSTEEIDSQNFENDIKEYINKKYGYYIDYYETIEARTKYKIISVVDKRKYSKDYLFAIYMVSIGIIILFLFLYFSLKRLFLEVISPINSLSETMNNIKEYGEFQTVEVKGFQEICIIQDTYNKMIHRIHYLMKDNERKERDKNKEEMKSLERQLNPHFLSNTLGNIRFIAMVSRFESIQKMTEALMYILNSSFRNNNSFHTLDEEIKILDSYIYLMKIRYANSFDVEYRIDETIKDAMVPKLMLQPFVENSITHGFEDINEMGKIHICIGLEDNNIVVEVIDNGKGMSKEIIENIMMNDEDTGRNVGIANIRKRIKLYYGEEYNIEMVSEPKISTSIKIKIPYHK